MADTIRPKRATIIQKTFTGATKEEVTVQKEEGLLRDATQALERYRKGISSAAYDLAGIARAGKLPSSLRGSVWPILLETHPFVQWAVPVSDECRVLPCPTTIVPVSSRRRLRKELAKHHRRQTNAPDGWRTLTPKSRSPAGEMVSASNEGNISSASSTSSTARTDDTTSSMNLGFTEINQSALDLIIEDAVISYLQEAPGVSYSHGMLYVCISLAEWILPFPQDVTANMLEEGSVARLLKTAFKNTMTVMHWSPNALTTDHNTLTVEDRVALCIHENVTRRVSHFFAAFRKLMPELIAYLDEEEANGPAEEWAYSWTQWWCAKELPKEPKVRLWDLYLGYRPDNLDVIFRPDPSLGSGEPESTLYPVLAEEANTPSLDDRTPADWHIFVCLALLRACKDELEELELSEIRERLSTLPKIDMQAILKEAVRLRAELGELEKREAMEGMRGVDEILIQ
ncbi:MAG: Protein required for Brome mosaic virus replication [Vezdaea acicularis]|nr:MAG: Protein required for Brome mosaic virus replication [Vezdaea acicularis]